MLTAEPAACPGTAPARGTRPQEEAATGDREEGGEVGDLLGEALRPARTPPSPLGLLGTPLPRAGGTLLLRHCGCRHLVWKPGGNSTLKAAELLPAGAQVGFILLFQAVAGDWPHGTWPGAGRLVCHGTAVQEAGTPETYGEKKGKN